MMASAAPHHVRSCHCAVRWMLRTVTALMLPWSRSCTPMALWDGPTCTAACDRHIGPDLCARHLVSENWTQQFGMSLSEGDAVPVTGRRHAPLHMSSTRNVPQDHGTEFLSKGT